MASDIEEEVIPEEYEKIMSTSQEKQKNTSPQHHRSFKHHVHFGTKAKRKISAPNSGNGGEHHHNGGCTAESCNSSNRHSPGGSSGFSDILDWLRPRAYSEYSKQHGANRRRSSGDTTGSSSSSGQSRGSTLSASATPHKPSVDEGFHSIEDLNLPLFVDTKMANAWVSAIPQECLYRRALSVSSEPFVKPYCRQRSNSEFGRYLIMRRSDDQEGPNEIVARLEDNTEFAYCQLLASMKCYDLMPQLGKVVVLDASLPIKKAFLALVNNWIRAAVVLDSETNAVLGLLTITDLLNMLLEMNTKKSPDIVDLPLSTGLGYERLSTRQPPVVVYSDHSVYSVAKLMCRNRLHRVIVFPSEQIGDPLFLLSKRMILKSLQKFIARLPLPRCMHTAIDEIQSRLGTWSNVMTVTPATTLHKSLLLFSEKTLSCLPVLDDRLMVVDVLTKADIMNLVVDDGPNENILQKKVQDALKSRREGVEKLVTCHKKTTLMLAVECLLQTEAHRLIIVNSAGHLEGIISVSDLMRFLIASF